MYLPIFGLLVSICITFFITKTDLFDSRPRTLRIYQLKGFCPGYEKAPIIWRDVNFQTINRTFYLNGKILVRRGIQNGLKLDLSLRRCQSRDALATCEDYQGIHLNRLCAFIHKDHTPWAPLVALIKPRIACPLQKGAYSLTNGTIDGKALFANWPFADYYWKTTVKVLDEVTDEVLMCIYMEAQTAPI
ncbi:uncharacterized protein LOC126264316 [Aethina tumida]|uniref:uncharacterized protein LOC126264316 n=1 Tax=Aethina tumida TaxID=116153 RepID=UPI00214945F0|nr:uncharacterized protein LOC126264316 [Aethina tumida]